MKEKTVLPRILQNARMTLLLMIVLTFVNIILYYMNSNVSFPYSAFIPYFSVVFGDYMSTLNGSMTYFYQFGAIAILCLVIYIIAWFASRKKSGWFIVVTILYFLDTLFMGYFLWGSSTVDLMIDLALHGFVLYSLARASIFHLSERKRLKASSGNSEVFDELSDTDTKDQP